MGVVALMFLVSVLMPPMAYDYEPKIPVSIIEGSWQEVHKLCGKLSDYRGSGIISACAVPGKKLCVVIWPEKRARTETDPLWRHERAHCNGWDHV